MAPLQTKSHGRSPLDLCLAVSLAILLSGCMVKFVSSYDPVFDTAITNLQLDVEAFLTKMEAAAGTTEGAYRTNKLIYDDIENRLHSILMRAQATPKNEITVKQVNLLIDNLKVLRRLHEQNGEKGLTKAMIDPVRTILDVQFRSIITAEIAKMRGRSGG